MADPLKENLEHESPESVFPLALTPIEKFFFWDDRPEQPVSSFFDLRFESPLDRPILEACIAKVLERNPLLRAHVSGDEAHLAWILSDQPFRLMCLTAEPPIVDGLIRPFDLRKETGCRFWFQTTPECSRILVQLHHSAADGIAFRGVLIDILHSYSLATGTEGLNPQDPSMLYDRFRYSQLRDRYNFDHLGSPKRQTSTWQRIKNAWYFHFQPPIPLMKTRAQDRGAAPECNDPLCTLLFDREISQRILRACQAKECGMNDVAIAILFKTCYEWNRKQGDKRRNGRLRILMPYDLRGRPDIRMPATNRLSLSFLGRNYSQCENLDSLISSVQSELKDAKETHLYLDILKGIQLGCKWPGFMKWALRKHDSMATAVLTYAGEISRGMSKLFPEVNELRKIGNAHLYAIMAAPPARRNTNISMAICINWDRICISAIWNRAVFTQQDCRDFLELYKIGLQHWCEAEEQQVGVYAQPETV